MDFFKTDAFKLSEYKHENMEECIDLFMDVFSNEPFNYDFLKRDNICRYFLHMENTPNFLGTIYLDGDKIAGFCIGFLSDYFLDVSYEINEIVIARHMQKKGIGKRLLIETEEYLRRFNVASVTLYTRTDIDAYDFYLRNSYSVVEKTVYMYKEIN